MLKKIAIVLITTVALTFNVNAGSDGELILKKNNPAEIKDCSEGFNRASFAFNQGLDKVIVRKGMNAPIVKLSSEVRPLLTITDRFTR